MLNVSAPFHSSLMEPAAQKLKKVLDKIEIKDAEIPVIANVNALAETKAADIRTHLVEQAAHAVRWEESVRNLIAGGMDTMVECGPGTVLSGFMRKIDKSIVSYHAENIKRSLIMEKLERTALVTGASRGIGRAIALTLGQAGYAVAVNYAGSEAAAEAVKNEIIAAGGKAFTLQGDVSDPEDVEHMFEKIKEGFGFLDVLVNNAGITRDSLLIRMKESSWDEVIATNLKGNFLVLKAAAAMMIRRKKGSVINISSVVGLTGNAGQVNYAAAKAGVIGMTKAAAKELASRGIRVNAVAPGCIVTDMTDKIPENIKEGMLHSIPLSRLGQTEEVAKAVLFLASDDASYITGQVLNVDGGMVM